MYSDRYTYEVVPKSWRRKYLDDRRRRSITKPTDPLVQRLLDGETILLGYSPKMGERRRPFRSLYNYFKVRGFALRMVTIDDFDKGIYRQTLMWAEKI